MPSVVGFHKYSRSVCWRIFVFLLVDFSHNRPPGHRRQDLATLQFAHFLKMYRLLFRHRDIFFQIKLNKTLCTKQRWFWQMFYEENSFNCIYYLFSVSVGKGSAGRSAYMCIARLMYSICNTLFWQMCLHHENTGVCFSSTETPIVAVSIYSIQ